MNLIQIHPSLYVQPVEGKGWGVFSSMALEAGSTIECSPVLILDTLQTSKANQTALFDYLFDWESQGQKQSCVAWGYLSLYNHSSKSNCAYSMDYLAGTMRIETICPIDPHTELTVNYHGDFDDPRPVWFPLADQKGE